MGQRHQYIVIYPEKNLGEGNCNNKPARAEVIHHQWLYGRTAILTLERVLTFVVNHWDGKGTDYMFGRSESGYTSGDGARAIGAVMSVDPNDGYYHRVHLWSEENDGETLNPANLEPDQFDNNDGITVIQFVTGEALPRYAFITPSHLEGSHWKNKHGKGPWSASEYLEFYYSKKEQSEWPKDLQERMNTAFKIIDKSAKLLSKKEIAALLPGLIEISKLKAV